jgi:hypothetical protein
LNGGAKQMTIQRAQVVEDFWSQFTTMKRKETAEVD